MILVVRGENDQYIICMGFICIRCKYIVRLCCYVDIVFYVVNLQGCFKINVKCLKDRNLGSQFESF